MLDMTKVIIPKSDQLNADDLLGGPITITIADVSIKPGTEQPVSISFDSNDGKVFRPCKSMARVMVHCWGPDASKYKGKKLTLYCDPKVKWGGMAVGGIRISHMSGLDDSRTMALTETKGSKKFFTVHPLAEEEAHHPLDEQDGTKWMDNLVGLFRDAATEPEVIEIAGHPTVLAALDQAPPKIKKRLNEIIHEAYDRVRKVDDGSSDVVDDLLDQDKFPS